MWKNKNIILVAIIFILVYLIYDSISKQYKQPAIYLIETDGCPISDNKYSLCCVDYTGDIYSCINRTRFSCREKVIIKVNINKFDLPETFYVCERYYKLDNSYENYPETESFFDEETNKITICDRRKIERNKFYLSVNYGKIPEMKGQISLMEIYIFDLEKATPQDLFNDLQRAEKIFEIRGDVVC